MRAHECLGERVARLLELGPALHVLDELVGELAHRLVGREAGVQVARHVQAALRRDVRRVELADDLDHVETARGLEHLAELALLGGARGLDEHVRAGTIGVVEAADLATEGGGRRVTHLARDGLERLALRHALARLYELLLERRALVVERERRYRHRDLAHQRAAGGVLGLHGLPRLVDLRRVARGPGVHRGVAVIDAVLHEPALLEPHAADRGSAAAALEEQQRLGLRDADAARDERAHAIGDELALLHGAETPSGRGSW